MTVPKPGERKRVVRCMCGANSARGKAPDEEHSPECPYKLANRTPDSVPSRYPSQRRPDR